MIPLEVAGDYITAIWSTQTTGSYLSRGGHLGLTNRGGSDTYVWIGAIPTFEFSGSVGTHESPSIDDVVDLVNGTRYTHDDEGVSGWKELVQDPYGRYVVKDGLEEILYHDGVSWNSVQKVYARSFVRKFGIQVPSGAYYEPLIAPTSQIYVVSANDSTRQIANLVT
jgi:hypothetical protein